MPTIIPPWSSWPDSAIGPCSIPYSHTYKEQNWKVHGLWRWLFRTRILSQTTMYARYSLAHSALCNCLRIATSQRTAVFRRFSKTALPLCRQLRQTGLANLGARSFATYVRSFLTYTSELPSIAITAARMNSYLRMVASHTLTPDSR